MNYLENFLPCKISLASLGIIAPKNHGWFSGSARTFSSVNAIIGRLNAPSAFVNKLVRTNISYIWRDENPLYVITPDFSEKRIRCPPDLPSQ